MLRTKVLRWRVAGQTALLVLGIIVAKLVIAAFSLEFISLSPLFTSVVAGGVFVLGLIVAGTLADYKEAERVPAEITAALTNIHDDCAAFKQAFPDLDLGRHEDTLASIVSSFHDDLGDPRSTKALEAIDDLNVTFLEMDRLGVAGDVHLPPPERAGGPAGGASCASTTCSGPISCPRPTS